MKTLCGQYFLQNGRALPLARRLPQESCYKFSFMILCIFHGLLKLNPSASLQFWLFIVYINYWLSLSASSVTLIKLQLGIYPNWYPAFSIGPLQEGLLFNQLLNALISLQQQNDCRASFQNKFIPQSIFVTEEITSINNKFKTRISIISTQNYWRWFQTKTQ